MSSPERGSTPVRLLKWFVAAAIAAAVTAILLVGYRHGRQEAAAEEEQERPAAAPSRVSVEAGAASLKLDAATQAATGIAAAVLPGTTQRGQFRANAVVLSIQSLIQLRTTYLADLAQLDKSKAALAVSQREYDRLKALYQDDQNVAAKTVEGAEGAWQSDQVSLRAANEAMQLNDALARQTWGPAAAGWVRDGSAELDRVLKQSDLLLQVSLSPQMAGSAPQTASLQTAGGKIETAQLVSEYPAVDPRIQSPSYLYRTPSSPDIVPGMTLTALLASGPAMRGTIVPSVAVVWWQGKAWAYLQTAPDRFTRREVPTEMPVAGGWFVSSGFAPGQKVVIRGAQQLLSEEFRSQIQTLSESGEE